MYLSSNCLYIAKHILGLKLLNQDLLKERSRWCLATIERGKPLNCNGVGMLLETPAVTPLL
jgi:hypothetical protein